MPLPFTLTRLAPIHLRASVREPSPAFERTRSRVLMGLLPVLYPVIQPTHALPGLFGCALPEKLVPNLPARSGGVKKFAVQSSSQLHSAGAQIAPVLISFESFRGIA